MDAIPPTHSSVKNHLSKTKYRCFEHVQSQIMNFSFQISPFTNWIFRTKKTFVTRCSSYLARVLATSGAKYWGVPERRGMNPCVVHQLSSLPKKQLCQVGKVSCYVLLWFLLRHLLFIYFENRFFGWGVGYTWFWASRLAFMYIAMTLDGGWFCPWS